ncbi:MAG: sigma-70 family RNA polymerase sigma factor [Bacteroidota bacterium]
MLKDEEHIDEIIQNKSLVSYKMLVEKYERQVFSVCYKIVKTREDAEEVAQDVFVVGFRELEKLKERNKFPNWILRIAYSKSVDWVRKKRIVTTEIDKVSDHFIKNENTPVSNAIHQNRKEIIEQAIHRLAPVEAVVITLFYIQDLPVKEIAEITSLSIDNVKVKLFRARIALKAIISNLVKTDLQDFIQD